MVLAAEKKQKSILYDDSTINKVEMVTKSVGMVYSGMGPDYRFVCTEHNTIFCYNNLYHWARPVGSVG